MSKDLIEEMYASKNTEYFSIERQLFKNAVKGNGLKILDIGCGTGLLGAFFRTNQQCEVHGIEINESAYNGAKGNLHQVHRANIEAIDLPYSANYFDVIIMGDVLEHLINPMGTINKLLKVLKPEGQIHITVPNIRYWKVLKNLVFNDKWQYESWGILDYTHLRFFTKTSIVDLMKMNDIKVIKAEWVIQNPSKSHMINKSTFALFAGFLASHIFLTIQK